MFDIGFSELLVIGIVALIVVGPKDLPGMFHTLGRFTARARSLAREFSRAMESAAKESGVDDVAKDLKKATSAKSMGLDALKGAADKFESWKPGQHGGNTGANAKKPEELSEDRAEMAKKINEATAARAQARLDAEAAAEAAGWEDDPGAMAEPVPLASEQAEAESAKKPAAPADGEK